MPLMALALPEGNSRAQPGNQFLSNHDEILKSLNPELFISELFVDHFAVICIFFLE